MYSKQTKDPGFILLLALQSPKKAFDSKSYFGK